MEPPIRRSFIVSQSDDTLVTVARQTDGRLNVPGISMYSECLQLKERPFSLGLVQAAPVLQGPRNRGAVRNPYRFKVLT